MDKQVKSRQRVADHGEVFTARREVNAMCDLVRDECERIDARFLEPACGEGAFLAEILSRKLNAVRKRYGKSAYDYERNAILALSSLYGVDILADNARLCRERLFEIWDADYTDVCKKEARDDARNAAKAILRANIVCGNALTLKCVDECQRDTEEPIIFPEWTFPENDFLIRRRDFRLDVLLMENPDEDQYDMQLSLFGAEVTGYENWMIDPITKEKVPAPVRVYEKIHYRRLGEDG